jgi:hypothetical protein
VKHLSAFLRANVTEINGQRPDEYSKISDSNTNFISAGAFIIKTENGFVPINGNLRTLQRGTGKTVCLFFLYKKYVNKKITPKISLEGACLPPQRLIWAANPNHYEGRRAGDLI